jgi:hypothetical protein
LFDDLTPVWLAFWRLHSGRQLAMGINALVVDSIIAYGNAIGYNDIDEFIDFIQSMDTIMQEHLQTKAPAK